MEKEGYSCCFTGYRPKKFPFKLSFNSRYNAFENKLTETLINLINNNCFTFFSGMAEGFDIIAAEAVLTLKEIYKDASINLICVIPFIEQSKNFSAEWKERYDNILSKCDKTILISDRFYPACFMNRNYYMVDNSDFVIAFYDGQRGGTQKTIDYAKRKNRKVFNLND